MDEEQHSLVNAEMSDLADRYRRGDIAELERFIQTEQRQGRICEFFYLITTPNRQPIAGNLAALPDAIWGDNWYYSFPIQLTTSRGARQRWV